MKKNDYLVQIRNVDGISGNLLFVSGYENLMKLCKEINDSQYDNIVRVLKYTEETNVINKETGEKIKSEVNLYKISKEDNIKSSSFFLHYKTMGVDCMNLLFVIDEKGKKQIIIDGITDKIKRILYEKLK
jgi:hypothetical protein